MDANNNKNWDDIVFEFRNKEYGAFYLKKKNSIDLITSAVIGVWILILVVVPTYIMQYDFLSDDSFLLDNTVTVDLMNINLEQNELPPPPELKPLQDDIDKTSTAIKVVDNTTEEKAIPTTDQLKDSIENKPVVDESFSDSSNGSAPTYGYYSIEEKPEFPEGGVPALLRWIAKNTQYPQTAYDKGIKGKVIIQFIIDAEGNVTGVELISGVNSLLDNEALRVVKSMPRWKPGRQRGKAVRVSFQIPINFTFY